MRKLQRHPKSASRLRRRPSRRRLFDDDEQHIDTDRWPGDGEDGLDCGAGGERNESGN